MDELGIPSPADLAKAAEAATGFAGIIQKTFPGISVRSIAKAESSITKRTMDDIDTARAWGIATGLSDASIEAMCNDIYRRNTRAERFVRVIEFAESAVNSNTNLHLPEQEWSEAFQEYAERACDNDMQRTWAAILAGELETPGSFSKRTMAILSSMSKQEAEAFKKLCSFTTYAFNTRETDGRTDYPLIALYMDNTLSTYNTNAMTVGDLSLLDSIGLVDIALSKSLPLKPGMGALLYTADGFVKVKNKSDFDEDIMFKAGVFLPAGIELARVCELGTGWDLAGTLVEAYSKNGLEASFHPRLWNANKFDNQ